MTSDYSTRGMNKVCSHSQRYARLHFFKYLLLLLLYYHPEAQYLFFNICCQYLLYTEENVHKAYERLAINGNTSDGSLVLIKLVTQWKWFFPSFNLRSTISFRKHDLNESNLKSSVLFR